METFRIPEAMKLQTVGSGVTAPEAVVWGPDCEASPVFRAFCEAHFSSPSVSPSPFGENKSWCLDILTLGHNAMRQEISDMYLMYESMVKLGVHLNNQDVKVSTLWFRTVWKFLTKIILDWEGEVFFPWMSERVKQIAGSEEVLESLTRRRGTIAVMSNAVCTVQASLSSELSGEAKMNNVQLKLTQVLKSVNDLGTKLLEYFRICEKLAVPLLIQSGVNREERDSMFRQLVARVFQQKTADMHLPMLVRWMPQNTRTTWLKRYAIDNRNRRVPLQTYNIWQAECYSERHHRLVQEIVRRAGRFAS